MPTSRFTDFSEEQFAILIFQCLVSIFDTGYLFSFKAKVIRVHFQLESPKSEHRNSTYVLINREYSIVKLMQEMACTGSTLSEFLSYLESEFGDTYKICLVFLEVYFNWPLESLKSDKK